MPLFRLMGKWLFALIAISAPLSTLGQHATATINGTVTDTTGSVVPGAAVILTNTDTNVTVRSSTNNSGYFTFVDVTPGSYRMVITRQGFKKIELPSFPVVVNQVLTENEVLSPGTVTDTVTVNAAAEGVMLEKSSSELGNVIQSKEIQQLPLNGRNFTQLLILSPGVTPVSTAQGSGISTTDAGISAIPGTNFYKPAFFGQQNRETFYLMDGIVNTDIRGAIYGFLPIIDAMQEFKVRSHMDSPEFGIVTGGVMSLWSGYLQDSWRATPKLTVNFGVRYDYLPAIHMLNDRLANGLDIFNQRYITQKPVAACGSTFTNPCIPNGIDSVPYSDHIVFANGAEQVGPPIKDNIGPRLGLAYQLRPRS